MRLRLPESGSILESLLNHLGHTTGTPAGPVVEATDEAQVERALDALERGDIEFVILEDDDAFLQAAGSGDGPYALQFSPDSSGRLLEAPGGVDRQTMRRSMMAYARGDATWRSGTGIRP
jgi:hypothetical protein